MNKKAKTASAVPLSAKALRSAMAAPAKPKAAKPHTPQSSDAPLPDSFFDRAVRALLLLFAATLPLYFDMTVPEVSGDMRWMATSFYAGLAAILLLAKALWHGKTSLTFRWPLILWISLGLAIWAAVSLVDALNWLRGIILLKALYAQLTLIAAVYCVATPRFIRQLMWALVLPLAFTSFVGIAQFHGWGTQWNPQTFNDALAQSWLFFWMQPLFSLLGYLLHPLTYVISSWPDSTDLMTQLMGFFQQSAVPGSTFANKNLAGSWTAMMLPTALFLLVTAKRWPAQALASVLLALGSLFLVYSRARASWVALFAGLLTFMALVLIIPAWRKAMFKHLDWKHLLWLMLPVAVLLKFSSDTSPVQGAYAVDRSPGQQIQALASSSWNEVGGRLAYNLNSLKITRDYWFNGVGLGSFYVVYPPYYNALVVTPQNSYSVQARPQRTHTDMMQAFDEMGIPGGLLYVGVFICGIAMAFRIAGPRAGALGGKLVGAGILSAVLALMIFVEMQGMLAIPSPWNLLTQLGFGAAILALLGWALRDAILLQKDTKPADDTQLLGLMAGIGVLTICVNSTMDFPMQLPTAPAAAALLLGAITAVYLRYNPKALVGPAKLTFKVSRPLIIAAVTAVTCIWSVFLIDAWKFREGNQLLKLAMIRIFSAVCDEQTIALLEQAYRVYPFDPRIHEHMAVAYANYNGATPMPIEAKIEKLEWVLKGDPWGANHLVNLASQYLQLVDALKTQPGNEARIADALTHVEDIYARLLKVADFSNYTWGVGGMLRLAEGKPEEAASLFRRSLAIDPSYPPAQTGLAIAVQRSSVSPVTITDKVTGR